MKTVEEREVKHKPVKQSNFFKIEGKNIERTRKVCPRCGDGTFMAKHKDRSYCGRCKYTEFQSRAQENQANKAETKDEAKTEAAPETEQPSEQKTEQSNDEESKKEYFVHVSGLVDEIREGDAVEYDLTEGRKGLNAVNVKLI